MLQCFGTTLVPSENGMSSNLCSVLSPCQTLKVFFSISSFWSLGVMCGYIQSNSNSKISKIFIEYLNNLIVVSN